MPRGLDRGCRGIDQIGAVRQLGRGDATLGFGDRGLVTVMLGDHIVELSLRHPLLVVERLRAIEVEVRLHQHGFGLRERCFEHVDLAWPLHLLSRVGKPRFGLGDPRLGRGDLCDLLGAFQREDRGVLLDAVALLHRQRLDAAALL